MSEKTKSKKLWEKIVYAPPLFIWWIIYVRITIEERIAYDYGRSRGVNCHSAKSDIFGTNFESTYGTQERHFMNWNEFWSGYGY